MDNTVKVYVDTAFLRNHLDAMQAEVKKNRSSRRVAQAALLVMTSIQVALLLRQALPVKSLPSL